MAAQAMAHDEKPQHLISRFTEGLREAGTARISSVLVAKRLGLNKDRLARLAGVHRNTLRNNPESDTLQERLRQIIRVITAAIDLTGDEQKAIYWFMNEPIMDYRGMTAAELVTAGKVDAVLAYIEDLRNGAAG